MSQAESLSKVLVVDDRVENLLAMESALGTIDAKVVTARSGNEALSRTLHHEFALILLDVQMPEMDGFETAELLGSNEQTRGVPIIFVTAFDRSDQKRNKGYSTGAVDFLYKPINTEILLSKVKTFLILDRQKHQLIEANQRLAELNKALARREQELSEANEHLAVQAVIDPLTGLFNRRHGNELLQQEMARVTRGKQHLAVIMLDLDFFKDINDTHGHECGDRVLIEISRRIRTTCRPYDTVIRWGGEEILILCPSTDSRQARCVAERLRKAIAETSVTSRKLAKIEVTASLGTAASDTFPGLTGEALISLSDEALYRAKAEGRNCVCSAEDGPPQGRRTSRTSRLMADKPVERTTGAPNQLMLE